MMGQEKTLYQLAFEKHYRAVLSMIEYTMARMADSAIEIASRAIALAAPLPNAINLSNVVIGDLGWGKAAAIAFAITIEIAVFYLVEVALKQFDGYLEDPKRYRVPLIGMVITLCVGASVVMTLVYHLETHKIMTLLPIISICAFVGIGLQRWHDRNQRKVGQIHSDEVGKLSLDVQRLAVQIDEYEQQIERQNIELMNGQSEQANLEQKLAIQMAQSDMLNGQLAGVRGEFERYRERTTKQLSERSQSQTVNVKPSRQNTRKVNAKIDGTFERRIRVLDMWKASGEMSLKDAADQIGVSKTTISNDLGWLEDAEVIHRTVNDETGKTVVHVNGNEPAFRAGELS